MTQTAASFATLADFALASYRVQSWEPTGLGLNDAAEPAAETAFERLATWQMLAAAQLGLANAPGSSNGAFQSGFRDGYYTNGNAAALVAVRDGTLVIAFRGTNDNGDSGSLDTSAILIGGGTPDEDNWFNFFGAEEGMGDYYALLAPLVSAVDSFVTANAISSVVVTGHSLGGAMVNAFMDAHADTSTVTYDAVTFANPGYFTFDSDTRIANFLNDTDLINVGDFVSSTPGDDNTLYDGLFAPGDTHKMELYNGVLQFMSREGVPDINGYDSFVYQVTETAGGTFLIASGNDRLSGGLFNDVLLGGAGSDVLDGGSGADWLLGGSGRDILNGDSGTDTLTGGSSKDKLTGSYGADDFDFNTVKDSGRTASSRDVITDFSHKTDDIDLSTIDAKTDASGNNRFSFLKSEGAEFTGRSGQLHWYQINERGSANDKTIIEGDINGDKVADFQIELTGLKTITSVDFIL